MYASYALDRAETAIEFQTLAARDDNLTRVENALALSYRPAPAKAPDSIGWAELFGRLLLDDNLERVRELRSTLVKVRIASPQFYQKHLVGFEERAKSLLIEDSKIGRSYSRDGELVRDSQRFETEIEALATSTIEFLDDFERTIFDALEDERSGYSEQLFSEE